MEHFNTLTTLRSLAAFLLLTLLGTSSLQIQAREKSVQEPVEPVALQGASNLGTVQPFATGPAVIDYLEISDTTNPELGLVQNSRFGTAVANIGDLDGDGVDEVVVGAPGDTEGGGTAGAFYVLFLDAAGGLRDFTKTAFDVAGTGYAGALATIGDLDGDGRQELAVGRDNGTSGVDVVFLNTDGSVNRTVFLDYNSTNYGSINDTDRFGSSLAGLGDVDQDGVPDLAVGARLNDNRRSNDGAVYVVFLNSDGSFKGSQEISSVAGSLDVSMMSSSNAQFGYSVAAIPDLDTNGVSELVVSEASSSVNIHLLYLETDGTVKNQKTIRTNSTGSGGKGISTVNDSDDNGIPEIILSTGNSKTERLFFSTDGELTGKTLISTGAGYFPQAPQGSAFGFDTTVLNDYNNDATVEIMYGAPYAEGNARGTGALYTLFEGEQDVYTLSASVFLDANVNGIRDESEEIFDIDDMELFADNGDGVYEYADSPAFENRDRLIGRLSANESSRPNLPVGDYWIVLFDEDDDSDEEVTLTTYASTTHDTNPILVSLTEDIQLDIGFAPATTIGNNAVLDENGNNVYDQTFEPAGTALDLNDADDDSEVYTLPFTFPFYGTNYSQITLNTNGQMCFQEFDDGLDDCDEYNGRLNPTDDDFGPFIAPLWMDQALESTPEDNIYVEERTDSVLFRWQSHGYDAVLSPLNYAVELFRDGDIELHYGPVPTEPWLDTDSSDIEFAPVVGINDGTSGNVEGVNYQALAYHTYLDEQELLFDSLPAIRLEYTAPGTYVETVVDDPGAADIEVNLYRDDGDTLFDPSADTFLRTTRTDVFGKYLLDVFETGDYWVTLNPDSEFYNARIAQASAQLITVESLGEHLFDADFLLTQDKDSVSNATENAAPNNGDANNDGVLDSLQTNVASLPTLSGEYLTLETAAECDLENVNLLSASEVATGDTEYEYPHGLVSFRANCAETEVSVYHYSANPETLRKLVGDTYVTVESATATPLVIDTQDVVRYTYTLTDGGEFDASVGGDGVIEDPFGLATPVAITEEPDATTTPDDTDSADDPVGNGPDTLIRTGGF